MPLSIVSIIVQKKDEKLKITLASKLKKKECQCEESIDLISHIVGKTCA